MRTGIGARRLAIVLSLAAVAVAPAVARDLSPLRSADSIPALGLERTRLADGSSVVASANGQGGSEVDPQVKAVDCLQSAVWFVDAIIGPYPVNPDTTPVPATAPLVALIDGAVDAKHPALVRFLVPGDDLVEQDGDPSLPLSVLNSPAERDLPGNVHATAVASRIAAVGPRVRIAVYRVLGADCQGSAFNLARAMVAAVDAGARVIALPLGSQAPSRSVRLALDYAAEHGVPVVAAAGNEGGPVMARPARDGGTVAVAAVDALGQAAAFTSYGPQVAISDYGVGLEIAYPAALMAHAAGSSLAAGHTAGVLAVLAGVAPQATGSDLVALLTTSAAPLSEPRESVSKRLGAGITDLAAALALVAPAP